VSLQVSDHLLAGRPAEPARGPRPPGPRPPGPGPPGPGPPVGPGPAPGPVSARAAVGGGRYGPPNPVRPPLAAPPVKPPSRRLLSARPAGCCLRSSPRAVSAVSGGPASTAIRPATAATASRRRCLPARNRRGPPPSACPQPAIGQREHRYDRGSRHRPGQPRVPARSPAQQHEGPPPVMAMATGSTRLHQPPVGKPGRRPPRRCRSARLSGAPSRCCSRVLSALLEAEHHEFQDEPGAPHQHAGPREIGPRPPSDEDEGPSSAMTANGMSQEIWPPSVERTSARCPPGRQNRPPPARPPAAPARCARSLKPAPPCRSRPSGTGPEPPKPPAPPPVIRPKPL